MKRALLIACLFALAASPALAYVQPGAFAPSGSHGAASGSVDRNAFKVPTLVDDGGRYGGGNLSITPMPGTLTTTTSQPVPEPGTMAMASMGLLALGATLRRRRGR